MDLLPISLVSMSPVMLSPELPAAPVSTCSRVFSCCRSSSAIAPTGIVALSIDTQRTAQSERKKTRFIAVPLDKVGAKARRRRQANTPCICKWG